MSRSTKEWLAVIAFSTAVGIMSAVIWRVPWPKCKVGDPGVVVGGMLVGGCPIYRNDGSVTQR